MQAPDTEQVSPVCERCSSLLMRPETSFMESQHQRVEYRREAVNDGATKGCRICLLILNFLQMDSGSSCSSYFLEFAGGRSSTVSLPSGGTEITYPWWGLRLIPDGEGRPAWLGLTHVMSIDLRHRTDIESNPAIQGFPPSAHSRSGENKPEFLLGTIVPVQVTPLAASTGDLQRLRTVDKWLTQCQQSHPRCSQGTDPCDFKNLPSRLINVSEPHKLRLVAKHELTSTDVRYATVSHRWRSESMPKLLKANLQLFRRSIDLHILSPVFRDSVTFCQRLGITYLWIDALCLIQDEPIDRDLEIGRMGTIYYHAFCNFSATATADRPVGLFVESSSWLHTAFPLVAERENQRFELYGYASSILKDVDDTALQKRGWVLQERLLSPRTISFGDQLSWECIELRANETFPGGLVHNTFGTILGRTFKLDNLRARKHSDSSPGCTSANTDKKYIYQHWQRLVREYTRCDLTFETDIFPAVSGLAKHFNEELQDTYLAGHWKGDLYNSIVWSRWRNPYHESGWRSTRRAMYRAPSWSWASVKGSIFFFLEDEFHGKARELAEILTFSVELAGVDPYGEVLDGHIQMRGFLRLAQHRKSSRNPNTPLGNQRSGEWFDDEYDEDLCRWTNGSFFLPMYYCMAHSYGDRQEPARITGLILEEVIGRESTYKRVGFFEHRHGEHCDKEVQREWYPELTDFNPNNYKRQDFTIV